MTSLTGAVETHQPADMIGKLVTLKPYNDYEANIWRRRAAILLVAGAGVLCLPYGFLYAIFTPYLVVPFFAPLGLLALLTIWALPDMRSAPTKWMSPLAYAFFIALVLWPNYLAIALPGLPWITIGRITSFPLTLLFLICVSVSADFRAQMADVLSKTPVVWRALAFLLGAQIVSVAFSDRPMVSIQNIIVAQTSWTAIFLVSCYVFLKPGRVKRLAVCFWIMAIIVGGLGLAESPRGQVMWSADVPSFLKVGDEVVQLILAGATRDGSGQYRIQATFSTALGLAEYCALALPFILHFIVGRFPLVVRILAALTVPFILYVIIRTDARLGLLGFFLSLMVYLFVWGVIRWTRSRASLVGPATVLVYPAIFAAFVAASFVVGRIRNKVWGGGQYNASNEARIDQVSTAIPKILTHPFGYGVGTGGNALGYTDLAGRGTIDSYYLLLLMDVGIVGAVAYLVALAATVFYATKFVVSNRSADPETYFLIPILVSLVNFAVIKIVFANAENHPIAFMCMGVAAALILRVTSAPTSVNSRPGFTY